MLQKIWGKKNIQKKKYNNKYSKEEEEKINNINNNKRERESGTRDMKTRGRCASEKVGVHHRMTIK